MRIAGSSMQFHAHHEAQKSLHIRETLRIWHEPPPASQTTKPPQPDPTEAETPCCERVEDVELLLLRLLIERLTGRKFEVADVEAIAKQCETKPLELTPPPSETPAARQAWGATYDREETRYEAESMHFSATGLVRTADGAEIAINVELTMSREFMTHTGIHVRAGAAALKDPLVINFAGSAAQLSQVHVDFDLDVDGNVDALPMLAEGSAYLALDRNGDGVINDGSELFGALTGDGFAELAQFDDDRNGWLDEADGVFTRLRLWSGDESRADALPGLQQQGVGAIHLSTVETPFELKQGEELVGAVRATGIYLTDESGAGTIQQIDVKV